MPLQEILQTQLQNTRLLTELMKESGQNTGRITTLEHRVDRIEDREHRAKLTPKDFLSFLPGLLVLVLALAGKLSWAEALSHLIGSGR